MPVDPTLPDISEAAGDALIAWMGARVASLNTRLARPALETGVAPPLKPFTAAQILLGDGDAVPAYDIWIAIQGGDADSGEELAISFELFGESDGRSYANSYRATVTAYVNPSAMLDADPVRDLALRHRVLSRLEGWLRADCFNNATALIIPLASQEYNAGAVFDSMKATMLDRIKRGLTPKGPELDYWTPNVQCSLVGIVY